MEQDNSNKATHTTPQAEWAMPPMGAGPAPTSVRDAVEGPAVTELSQYEYATAMLNDDDDYNLPQMTVEVKGRGQVAFVCYGTDNLLPYHRQNLIHANSVTARCQVFNIQTCYAMGLHFAPRQRHAAQQPSTRATRQPDGRNAAEIARFTSRNNLPQLFMEQVTDMKFFDFTVMLLCLSRDRSRVVKVLHRDACHVRFTPRTAKGRPESVVIANFRHGNPVAAEMYTLLDPSDPLGDLLVRQGREHDPATGLLHDEAQVAREPLVYAVLSRMPTVGCSYYPMPYYTAIFNDYWYDIYRLIGIGKRHLVQNTSAPRLQIEVHKSYWDNVCDEEHITDELRRLERKLQERRNITEFCTKPENAGKAWVTSYDTTLDGKEISMVRVKNLNQSASKEGGDWSEDMQEAANSICFAMGVHPNVVGAVPGKSQMNNSGSDKRELFTLKQSLEKTTHDILMRPWEVVLHYNGWEATHRLEVPFIELTTLDKGASYEVKQR